MSILFDEFIDGFANILNKIEQPSSKCGLSAAEGMTLVMTTKDSDFCYLVNENILNSLQDKGMIKYGCEKVTVTSKGCIVAKSILSAINAK